MTFQFDSSPKASGRKRSFPTAGNGSPRAVDDDGGDVGASLQQQQQLQPPQLQQELLPARPTRQTISARVIRQRPTLPAESSISLAHSVRAVVCRRKRSANHDAHAAAQRRWRLTICICTSNTLAISHHLFPRALRREQCSCLAPDESVGAPLAFDDRCGVPSLAPTHHWHLLGATENSGNKFTGVQ